ncbi:MAG: hypothetical protein LBL32_02700 [Holosporales bacterium]|jgi:hypothetical protein|nr:hypothetical protein [Holosporales bacterium]
MTKKGIVLLGIIATIGAGVIICQHQFRKEEGGADNRGDLVDVMILHSDILRKIAEEKTTVSGITQEAATDELASRGGLPSEADAAPIDIEKLPIGILVMIARSPASIAGIKPGDAYHEIVNRTVGFKVMDVDHLSQQEMLEALQNYHEKKIIEKWAENEDGEVVAQFLRKEASENSSDASRFVEALIDKNPDLAKSFIDRYAAMPQEDNLDNTDEAKTYEEVAKAKEKTVP